MTRKPTAEQQMAKRFANDTKDHELTVLHDDGLYRHIRLARPNTSLYRVDLVTWPGHLAVSGDIDGYTFKCAPDMFDFFRRSTWNGGPNPTYWDEKVTAGRDSVMAYSEEILNGLVAEELAEGEADWPGVTADWHEKTASFFAEYDLGYEETARYAVHNFEYLPDNTTGEPFTFSSDILSDISLKDFRWSFLWACHAIVAGIAAYDQVKAEQPQPEPSAHVEAEIPTPELVAAATAR